VPTLVLLRHGRTTANAGGVLAGRLPNVHLDAVGKEQAQAAAERLAAVKLDRIVSSPLVRCRETAEPLVRTRDFTLVTDKGFVECDYGAWQGAKLKELAKHKLWSQIQTHPSSVRFPDGESMADMSSRIVAAVRRHNAELVAEHGADAVWLAVSHGDLIKAVLADALGMHLDSFQRINVDPASVSLIHYSEQRATVLATNTHAGDLAWLTPKKLKQRRRPRHETLGGGSGPPT
jgi:probable phosphomutase (TIGR03848 family)